MQAIATRFLKPSAHKGSRIKATAGQGESLTRNYMHQLSIEENHKLAALILSHKLDWTSCMTADTGLIGGHTNRGMVWVFRGNCSPQIDFFEQHYEGN
jgi:hypothetical protein